MKRLTVCFVLLALFVVSAQLCYGGDNDVTISNNAGKDIYVAVWYRTTGIWYESGQTAYVTGWYAIKPGASRTFDRGWGDFYFGIQYKEKDQAKEVIYKNWLERAYFWVQPDKAFKTMREASNFLKVDDKTNREQHALKQDWYKWGQNNKASYDGGFDYDFSVSDFTTDGLKRSGWKVWTFYKVPRDRNTVNITHTQ